MSLITKETLLMQLQRAEMASEVTLPIDSFRDLLYQAMPKEWVELTEYDIKGVLGLSESWVGEDCSIPDMIGFAKAIDAKLKEKNHVVSGT